MINRGDTIKVYHNKWMHPKCVDMQIVAGIEAKELRKPPNGDLWSQPK